MDTAVDRAEVYASSIDHLVDELGRVDVLVRVAVHRARQAGGDDAFRGLAVSEADVDALLDRALGKPPWAAAPQIPSPADVEAHLGRLEAALVARRAASERAGVPLRLAQLAARCGLDRFAVDVLLLAFAPEIDLKYERLFAYLNDDVTRKRPTVDAVLGLLCPGFAARLAGRARFSPAAPLSRHGLVHVLPDPSDPRAPLLACALKVDDRVTAFLHGDDALDARLAPYASLTVPIPALPVTMGPQAAPNPAPPSSAPSELHARLSRFVRESAAPPLVYLEGPPGAGKRAAAGALAAVLRSGGAPLLTIDCAALLAAGDEVVRAVLPLAAREARLSGAAALWSGGVALLDEGKPAARAAMIATLADVAGAAFVTGEGSWDPVGALAGRSFLRVAIPRPGAAEQAVLWSEALGGARAPDLDLEVLTSTVRLTGGQIEDAARAARDLARYRDPADSVRLPDVLAACRSQHGKKLGALARRVPQDHGWDDLILLSDRKALLREICLQVRHRARVLDAWGMGRKLALGKGLTALFSGPPGTGKTMAAGVIARELGLEMFAIDLSSVVSKYIGETEKHLAQLFAEAEAANAALFFDEADALFGKRTEVRDAHDRYANQEVSYLLQRIDAYEGVVILASNLTKNMDEAFLRRIQFSVEFPFPGHPERLAIWQGIFPSALPLAPEVDLEFLARKLELAGGHIRNVALAAAFLAAEEDAAVGMRHLLHAARRELQKIGKVVDDTHFSHR